MNNKIKIYFLFFILVVVTSSCGRKNIINEDEINWLKRHRYLVVGISPNAPPYQFVDDKGKVSGIFIDFLFIKFRIDML